MSPRAARRLVLGLGAFGGLTALGALMVNVWMVRDTRASVFSASADFGDRRVGLVLGTSPLAADGFSPNPFFAGRVERAAELYIAGKVRHLLLSGDHREGGYNEPLAMREALLTKGVPEDAMTLDFAGFRTLDSLARTKRIFGLKRCTIITDDFHVPRALFLARAHGIDALACASRPVPWARSKKTRIREWIARVLAVMDVAVLRRGPKFDGDPSPLPQKDLI
jgi:SanA protein